MNDDSRTPEFSRPVEIGKIPPGGLRETISADAGELKALAARMKIPAINSLSAELRLEPWKKGRVRVRGNFTAEVEQQCVRTLDIFTTTMDEPVERIYVRPQYANAAELRAHRADPFTDPDAPDVADVAVDDVIDLGELVAESLALALDPWPRKPGTDFVDYSTGGGEGPDGDGEEGENGKSPFAALGKLRSGR